MLNTVHSSRSAFKGARVDKRQQPSIDERASPAALARRRTDGSPPSLWFDPPVHDHDRRHQLTRERVVAEALAVIAEDGVQALTMRRLAARLEVVPGALYHHVRNKQQLHDLVLDNVLAEVDIHLDPSLGWTDQLKVLAHRLRQVLEDHPGVAGILKTRDPLGPHSLALAAWANTSGSTTATSGSAPACRCWSMGWSMRAPRQRPASGEPTDDYYPSDPPT